MHIVFVIASMALASHAQPLYDLDTAAQETPAEEVAAPMPYSFEYSATDDEGSHSHQSSSDGKTVTGQYSIMLADGRMRTVKYTADENGYRAEIITNELGTESKNPADVTIQSSAPTGAEAAQQTPPAAPTSAVVAPAAVSAEQPAAAVEEVKPAEPSDASASYQNYVYVPARYDYSRRYYRHH